MSEATAKKKPSKSPYRRAARRGRGTVPVVSPTSSSRMDVQSLSSSTTNLQEIMREEKRLVDIQRKQSSTSLQHIMAQQLYQKLLENPGDSSLEEQMLELAVKASIIDK